MSYVWVMTFVYCISSNKCVIEKDKRQFYYSSKEKCKEAARPYFVKVICEKVEVIQ
jgi:hypothetical protein